MECKICGLQIKDGEPFGFGNGGGSDFAHTDCYWRRESDRWENRADELLAIVQEVIDWNIKYPSQSIYNESSIRKIASEMDAIFEKAKVAIGKSNQ